MQSLKNCLVFYSNFHKFFLALNSVETCFFDAHRVVKVWLRILHNVGHLLQENTVFPLNLSITPLKHCILLGVPHSDSWLIGFLLVAAYSRLDFP